MTKQIDWADIIENEIAHMYGSHGAILAADADGMIAKALRDERDRCIMIVQAARNGDIDTDFRSISHHIAGGSKMSYENGEYKDVEE